MAPGFLYNECVYCIRCHYELRGLEARHCPECGHGFDPWDASSYTHNQHAACGRPLVRRLAWVLVGCGALPLIANLSAMMIMLIAWVSLGRWPDWQLSDSPRAISGTKALSRISESLVLGSIIAPVVMLGLTIAICIEDRSWRSVWRVLLAIAVWVVGGALIWWDPMLIWYWLFD